MPRIRKILNLLFLHKKLTLALAIATLIFLGFQNCAPKSFTSDSGDYSSLNTCSLDSFSASMISKEAIHPGNIVGSWSTLNVGDQVHFWTSNYGMSLVDSAQWQLLNTTSGSPVAMDVAAVGASSILPKAAAWLWAATG